MLDEGFSSLTGQIVLDYKTLKVSSYEKQSQSLLLSSFAVFLSFRPWQLRAPRDPLQSDGGTGACQSL
jgi:hypothetical protein